MGEAWIIDAVRTPRGKGRKDVGALVHTHPQELLATTLRALAARNGIDPHDVDDVVVGCVSQAGDQGACIARSAVRCAAPGVIPEAVLQCRLTEPERLQPCAAGQRAQRGGVS